LPLPCRGQRRAGSRLRGAATAEREPTWDDLPAEVIYETDAVAAAPAEDDAALEAAFEAAATPVAAPEREPTWDDLPDEVIHETAPAPPPQAGPEPTWDDLPDEVIYETDRPTAIASPTPTAPACRPPSRPPPAARTSPRRRPAVVAAPVPRRHALRRPGRTPPRAAAARRRRCTRRQPPRHLAGAAGAGAPGQQPASAEPSRRRAHLALAAPALRHPGLCAGTAEGAGVVLPVPLLPLRGTAPAMLGIMNLRGQVVPVMDLGLHLGAAAAEDDAQTRIVVLEEDGETIGLRVSAVEDVANLTDSQIEPPDTARICQISNDLFRGVARVSQRPMILLDATRLLS
jgi:purine-binding chemotaxis protein CheW